MNSAWRLALFGAALAALAPGVWHVAWALPAFGDPTSLYGATVNAVLRLPGT